MSPFWLLAFGILLTWFIYTGRAAKVVAVIAGAPVASGKTQSQQMMEGTQP